MTDQPIAVTLDQFLDLPIEDKPPLLGTTENSAIVAGAMVLLGGQAGLGKTTLLVDAIFHFASGLDWLEFPVNRPLHILVIENEGPLRQFQAKLAAKRKIWQHELTGSIHVQTAAWGYFSFADIDHHTRIKNYLDAHQIDLVIGDPIGTLGMEGVGSPEDTRNFVRLLIPLGLFNDRAFIFPVHFTKEPRRDEINQISGAWGGHLDTLMILKQARRKDELRLSFPKLRWWSDAPPEPMILGKVYNTQSFEILRREGEVEPLEDRIVERLSTGEWLTSAEIARKDGGIDGGARRVDVEKVLQARSDLFRFESGASHGRSARAIVWQLVPDYGQVNADAPAEPHHDSQTELVPADAPLGTTQDASDVSQPNGTTGTSTGNRPSEGNAEHLSVTPPLKGVSGQDASPGDHEPVPITRTGKPVNGETDDLIHSAETWIATDGYRSRDPLAELVSRYPTLGIADYTRLEQLARTTAAARRETES